MDGEKIKQCLYSKGVTQKQLAELLGVTPQSVNAVLAANDVRTGTLERIAAAIGVDMSFFYGGAGETEASPATSSSPIPSVPYYDVTFECGFDELEPPFSEHPDGTISMPGYERATLWCRAEGHSMSPEISNGDLIALHRLSSGADILYGEVYGLVTTSGMRTIKRIRRSDDPACLRLVPTNPDYDPQDIPKTSIIAVYRVLGAMKKF